MEGIQEFGFWWGKAKMGRWEGGIDIRHTRQKLISLTQRHPCWKIKRINEK
jgi:hypothetical protein